MNLQRIDVEFPCESGKPTLVKINRAQLPRQRLSPMAANAKASRRQAIPTRKMKNGNRRVFTA